MNRLLRSAFAVLLLALVGCDDELAAEYAFVGGETDTLPRLPSPFTAEETTAMRESFDWAETADVLENDTEGRPAYYYALILVGSREQADVLELARIYHDPMPLFPEEMGPWNDPTAGTIDIVGDDHGTFVYAFVPGAVYNEIRRGALAGEQSFEAVILRDAPDAAAQRPEGYLDFDVLIERGCTFGITDEEMASELETRSGVGMSTSPLLGRLIRGLVRLGRGIATGVRRLVAIVRLKRDFSYRMRVVNSDPQFYDPSRASGTLAFNQNILRRAWGAEARAPIVPHGAMLVVRNDMAVTQERLSRSGEVRMRIPRARDYVVFLQLRNEAAVITGGSLWERRVKLYRGDWGVHDRSKPIHVAHDVRDRDVHELALFTDARDFAVSQLQFYPRRAVIVDGPIDHASRNSSAACWSFFGVGTTAFGSGRGWSLVGVLVGRIFSDFDIVIRGNDGASRGIVVHEYGHFMMCNMFRDISRRDFGRAYGEVIQDTVDNPSGSPSDQARLIAEGWADFYTAQVVGGTNYFAPLGTRRSENVAYCDQSRFDSTQPCTEDNIGGPIGTFPNARSTLGDPSDRAIGRFTTLMVDAFDSASTVPDRSVLNAGARWQFIAPTTPSGGVAGVGIPTLGGGLDDESATLAGSDLTSIIRAWSDRADRLRFNSFYDAIASVITLRHDESTACNVFALHEPTNDCTRLAPILGESADKSLPAPFGLRVTSTLNATASTPVVSASWALAAPGATHAYVEVYHGPLMLEGITLPYALSGTWTSTTNLPFDAPLTVRVAASLGVSANSAYLSGTVRTPSEPVHIATATADWRSANVSWTQTAATSYAVRTTAVVSGVTTWTATGNTNSINIGSLQPDTQYRFEVFSVNASGETCPVSSPSTFATPYEIIIE